MSHSLFVPIGVLFSRFNHFDLTLLDCSKYVHHEKWNELNCFKLEFRVENYDDIWPKLHTRYINTRTKNDFSFMVGRKFTKNDWNPDW